MALAETAPASPAPCSPALSPSEVFAGTRMREKSLSRLLMAFATSGLFFMLFPGTFLGVWNLLQISGRESAGSVSPAWLQAHGHAQVFGWVGSFILGIGFYSIPGLRGGARPSLRAAWLGWVAWTTGAAMRWAANVYLWQWRTLLPLSASLELIAFLIFFRAVSGHRVRGSGKRKLVAWICVVAGASTGLLLVLTANLAGCIYVAFRGATPAFPHLFDQRFLALTAWGFLVPFVWGFSAKWISVFLGLEPPRTNFLLGAVAANLTGLVLVLSGDGFAGSCLLALGAALAIAAIRVFEAAVSEPKSRGVHRTFPYFPRIAYGWLLLAACLGVAASRWDSSGGIWGASRHALTVGFVSTMILSVGQRVLPAFAGMRILWSPKLMFAAGFLLTLGCGARVVSEVVAYESSANWAWRVLPLSALTELAALTLFALNMMCTFILQPVHSVQEPMIARIAEATR